MREQWRPVPGWEGLYEVSTHGRVRSMDRTVPHARWGTATYRGRILAQVRPNGRYPAVTLCRADRSGPHRVHTLVAAAFLGPCPPGQWIRHLDDDKTNNHVWNLEYGTPSQNMIDSVRNGVHYQTRKTHCKHGHDLAVHGAVRKRSDGRQRRDCQACRKAQRSTK